MKNVCLPSFFVLFIYFHPSISFDIPLKCPSKDKCLCIPPGSDFEFQCYYNDTEDIKLVIHIEEKRIRIDCTSHLDEFNINDLPNITINRIDNFQMRFCSFPKNGFKEILDHFSLKEVKSLLFGSSDIGNITLTKEYFKGLEFLDSLILNSVGIAHLEEDVFANTPNLTSLELQKNKILLQPNIFQYTPKLKSLDLSENGITVIPRGIFRNLGKLEQFHLWFNKLPIIGDFTFEGLTSLRSLELSLNQIEYISKDAFKRFVNLTRLNLSSNKLEMLDPDTFSQNTKLNLFFMKNNNMTIPERLLSNLPQLKEVDLSGCQLKTLPENIFQNSTNIKSIKLGDNHLSHLSPEIFQGLELEKLDLSYNRFEKVGNMFAQSRSVKNLNLDHNQIGGLEMDDFKYLTKLESLDLSNNKIQSINSYTFQNNYDLKTIDLSNNLYSEEHNSQISLLENTVNIESVNFGHNMITQIQYVISTYNKVKLRTLDFNHNRITNISLTDLQSIANKLTINLENNNISLVDFSSIDVISEKVKDAYSGGEKSYSVIYLDNNPLDCSCRNYDLIRYIQNDLSPKIKVIFQIKTENVFCQSPSELKNWPIESVPQKLVLCTFEDIYEEDSCPEDCSCAWRPFDDSLVVDCSNKNFTEVPEIDFSTIHVKFNQTEIHLEGNYLHLGPDQNSTGYNNVTRLFLSHNMIEEVTWLPPQLEVLQLDNNKISYLDYWVLDMLNSSNIVNLTLDNNPWSCQCTAVNFTNFLRQHTKVVDAKNIRCFNSTSRLIDLNRNDLCHQIQIVYGVVGVLVVLLVAAFLLMLYYRHQQTLKVWLYAHNLCLWWVTEEELDKDKLYDAFISYSHKDEDFVVQNLLPVLEGGPNPYRLCIHVRHFIPGEFIATQVTKSVQESCRTLVVLSSNYIESVWGKMEFRTAHSQAMTDGRTRVIILLYGNVEIDKLDDELKAYLKTNTYIQWGDPYFWNKLKYALPHSRKHIQNTQKLANVMNCIDDKFNLVAPVTPSPGTTPPALDAKKHPLNFVPSDLDTPPAESGILLDSTCV